MSEHAVLVIGLPNDPMIVPVLKSLKNTGIQIVHWNPRNLYNDCSFRCEDGQIDGWITVENELISLKSIIGVFNRMSDVELTPEYRNLPHNDQLGEHAITAVSVLSQWCDVAHCTVLNRALANEPNSTKAYQSLLIQPYFDIPDTLITNNPSDVMQFLELHGSIIYKSCSGERSIVKEVDVEDLMQRADSLRACPVQFQQKIEGIDTRIHVIGSTTIATEVSTQTTDYRYDSSATWKPCEISGEHAAASVALAHSMDLGLAGIDLRITKEGRAYCFEVNPSPAFCVYENVGGESISDAIADYLVHGG